MISGLNDKASAHFPKPRQRVHQTSARHLYPKNLSTTTTLYHSSSTTQTRHAGLHALVLTVRLPPCHPVPALATQRQHLWPDAPSRRGSNERVDRAAGAEAAIYVRYTLHLQHKRSQKHYSTTNEERAFLAKTHQTRPISETRRTERPPSQRIPPKSPEPTRRQAI